MNCRTCRYCQIANRNDGYCHLLPPGQFFQRWVAVDSTDAIVPISQANQLIPSYNASCYPTVNPNKRGCSYHSFWPATWWRWKFGQQLQVPAPVEQKRG